MMNPERILLAGDTHADVGWVLFNLPKLIKQTRPDLLIVLGDFGFWPRSPFGRNFLTKLNEVLTEADLTCWWLDGNHEDHAALTALTTDPDTGRRIVSSRIENLPRGHRWTFGHHRWMAVGGGVSIDRRWRTESVDWFATEVPSPRELHRAAAGGRVEVLLTHDASNRSSVLNNDLAHSAPWIGGDEARDSARVRDDLTSLAEAVGPNRWFHGHYHLPYAETINLGVHAPCAITGLSNCDGPSDGTWALVGPDGAPLTD